jgi:5-methylcytosine-specific restriction endonuclease McrA
MIAPKAFKQCVKCHNEYPATPEFFYRTRSFIDGLESTCKVCQNAHLTLKRRPRQPEINRKQRERCAANREETNAEAKVRYHKRRALKKGNGGTYTAQDIQDQLKRQRHKCYYCQLKFEKTQKNEGIKYIYHIEHVVPLTRNGSNDMSNIVLACPTCNLRKHNRLPHEWPEGNRLL